MVGVGPGDPELITIKAVNTLKRSDFIFYPAVTSGKNKLAYNVVKSIINLPGGWDIAEERLIPLEIEMKLSKGGNDRLYKENAIKIINKLSKGDCSYVTIGDPMFYSTYWGLYNAVKDEAAKNNAALKINVVSGISSFHYSFNLIGEPYIIKNSSVLITVPVKKDLKEMEGEINFMAKKNMKPQVIVFMKAGFYIESILGIFKNLYHNNFREGRLKLYLIEKSELLDGFCDSDLNLKIKRNSDDSEAGFDYFSILIGVFL